MPVTFIELVDDSLRRVGVLQTATDNLALGTGTASELFEADSNIQHSVDIMLQVWRETTHEIYSLGLVPNLMATATIILIADTRQYTLPGDFERIAGDTPEARVMRGATTAFILKEYPGGYLKMLSDQPVATDWTGDPERWAISPENEELRIDREPTSDQAGDIYNIAYERRIDLTSTMATATMPFTDTVAYALLPVVTETWSRAKDKEFDAALFRTNLTRALTTIRRNQRKTRWGKRGP